jgi:hypothetical protein
VLAFGLVGLFIGPVLLAVSLAIWREWLEEHRPKEEAVSGLRLADSQRVPADVDAEGMPSARRGAAD